MNKTVTRTIELTPEDVKAILTKTFAKEFKDSDIRVDFIVSDTSDDRFGGSPSYNVVGIRLAGKSSMEF